MVMIDTPSENIAENIPQKITIIQEKRQISEMQLARELGVTQAAISLWKNGRRTCSCPQVAYTIHEWAKSAQS